MIYLPASTSVKAVANAVKRREKVRLTIDHERTSREDID
jgi:hypothetical protein